jgi:glycosyltransferase involved in cell wall biosynthesis
MQTTESIHPLRISFYTRGTEFNGDTIKNKGLGGSESALLYLARELSKRGHDANVFCSCDKPGCYDGVTYHHAEDFVEYCDAQPQDICVFSRVLETLASAKARVKILWLHDIAAIQYYMDTLPALDKIIDRYFLISAWQQQGFTDTFDFGKNKLFLTRNGIDLSLFVDPPPRYRNKLVYINTPFRGLDVLVGLFPHIKQAVPDVELHLYTGMSLYGDKFNEIEQQMQVLYDHARKMPGVVLHEPLPKAELAQELMSARLALYPSHFPECCSIASLETQAAGTPMITSALAGLNDTITHDETGILVPVNDPEFRSRSKQYQVEFLNQTIRLLKDDSAWQTLSGNAMKNAAGHYSWQNIATEWETEFYNILEN